MVHFLLKRRASRAEKKVREERKVNKELVKSVVVSVLVGYVCYLSFGLVVVPVRVFQKPLSQGETK